jgi:anaerobic magnesium-protoporphyrin IX monomethyl ester cyclase
MNVLMIEIPTVEKDGSVPFGILYAASCAKRAGHAVTILDLVNEDKSVAQIKQTIKTFKPGVIGIGGITSGYRRCKELVPELKRDFPEIPVVAGGVITSVSDLLLTRAGVDLVVRGEAEVTFPELLKTIEGRGDPANIDGISFVRSGTIVHTNDRPQVGNLDDIPAPAFDLLDMPKYLSPVQHWIDWYFAYDRQRHAALSEKLRSTPYMFPIITARGCTHRCIFCYRHHKGLRQHSVDYVVRMMRALRDTYGIGTFQINDELTTGNRSWVMEFCRRLRDERLGLFFIILSARVDSVDEEVLSALKSAGCLMINYGYESGSDIILKEIRKGVTRQQALQAGKLTKQAGIKNVPEIIIGFPSETQETVCETVDFLRQLDAWPISVNTPIPFPQTPLWDLAVERGLIRDKEEFILGYARGRFLNFTAFSDAWLHAMVAKVNCDTRLHWLKARSRYGEYLRCLILEKLCYKVLKPVLPLWIYTYLRNLYRGSPKGQPKDESAGG